MAIFTYLSHIASVYMVSHTSHKLQRLPEASNLYDLIGMLLQASEKNVDFEASGQITFVVVVVVVCIRASVDALCRDETDQNSRDPHTKSILTRRERLAILRNAPAVAHGFISSCTYAVIPHTYLGVLHARICSHAISGFSCHHHHYSSSSSVNPLSPNRNKFMR